MGKLLNMMYMVDLLNTGNIYSLKELSKKIGVTERMIRYYKSELEKSGIYVEHFMGPNGGYFLNNNSYQYNHFNKYDLQLLEGTLFELEKSNYVHIEEYAYLIEKVKHLIDIEEEKSKVFFDDDSIDNSNVYFKISECIRANKSILILYENLESVWQERKIHPLIFFKYSSKVYVTAFCELRQDIRHFDLERIKIVDQ